jgi:hypothetical protein
MTIDDARAMLQSLSEGQCHMPLSQINEALILTGDLKRTKVPQRAPLEAAREWPFYHQAKAEA